MKNYLKHFLAGIIFLLAYAPTFVWMWDRWFARDSYYSHGILVPFVSLFLIWQRREELKKMKPAESGVGLWLIILGFLVHVFSSLFRVYFLSGFSMLFVLAGLILFFWGAGVFKKVAFPVAFLVFMIPLPLVVISNISFRLKMFAAEVGKIILNQMGILAKREGSIIYMRHAQVVVEDVCSGLRSLISLTALGSIFAYWMRGHIAKRLFLFLTTIPIAIVTNACRVILLSAISEIWGPQYATGFIHDLSGFMVFGLAFILLYSVGKLLE
ncbi:MAG TPA: exosortase A [Candidatus Omnitrophica bacterium]|nr:MAG: hypothetical protein A2Z81_08610 [Omnitrophica WOR_2 bacterium GWA2_45_18]OGX19226.1 MAG: hypothetical protein A2Y04_00185 [Omnitrophica WOR_2 bacterium GWC2_45_7]HBR15656.1 exosortase A [Candidatus Omnitrophota bacterium]